MGSRVKEIAFAWPPVAPIDCSTYISAEKSSISQVSSSAGQTQIQNQQRQHLKYNSHSQQQQIAGPPLYQFTPCVPTPATKSSAGRAQDASFAGMTCDLTKDDDDDGVTGGNCILSIASSLGSTTGPIVHPSHPAPQQSVHHYAPQQVAKVTQSTSLMSPLSSGGFIFNYPPLYSETPLPPFSRPHPVSASFAAIQQIPINAASIPSTPSSPTSPVSDNFSVPGSPLSPISGPVSPQFTAGSAPVGGRQQKLEKYKQKRTKRNYNRPADQSRRERAQSRTRDEFGHFIAYPKKSGQDKEKIQFEMEDVRTKLDAWMKESQALKDKLYQVESRLEEQQKINTQLLHENRILWSTMAPSDVFNTTRPGSSYSEAFKEKIDLTNIELNWTDSPYLESMKIGEIEVNQWPLDVDSTLDFSSS